MVQIGRIDVPAELINARCDQMRAPLSRISGFGFEVPGIGCSELLLQLRLLRLRVHLEGTCLCCEFQVPGFEFRFLGCGFWAPGSGFRVSGSGCRVPDSGFRVSGSGFRVSSCGFRVPGFGIRVRSLRFVHLNRPQLLCRRGEEQFEQFQNSSGKRLKSRP